MLLCRRVLQVCVETMMHLTCTNMPVEKLESALKEVRALGLDCLQDGLTRCG